jgi:hypothetical protein
VTCTRHPGDRRIKDRCVAAEKAQKTWTTNVDKKETSKTGPEGWTIVESKSKSIKDRYTAPEKRTSEKHTPRIMITYNQRKTTMVAHPDTTQAQATITNDYRNVKQFNTEAFPDGNVRSLTLQL